HVLTAGSLDHLWTPEDCKLSFFALLERRCMRDCPKLRLNGGIGNALGWGLCVGKQKRGVNTPGKHVWQMSVAIIMANVNHDDEVPVVEPNQHNDVPVVPEPVLEDEDEDPEEEEFEEEEEDPQEEEDDMEVNIEEDKNEPELTCPYKETYSLNPLPPSSESEPDNEIKVEKYR
ncbi:hypothetical protein Tco_0571275, partial [Tanacetum coccineum]